jgi:hypothetical protein
MFGRVSKNIMSKFNLMEKISIVVDFEDFIITTSVDYIVIDVMKKKHYF